MNLGHLLLPESKEVLEKKQRMDACQRDPGANLKEHSPAKTATLGTGKQIMWCWIIAPSSKPIALNPY